MKVHHNAEKLCAWIRQHGAATVKQIAASGTLNSRSASDAVQYAVRHGVAGHHAVAGAIVGCAVGHHMAKEQKGKDAEERAAAQVR